MRYEEINEANILAALGLGVDAGVNILIDWDGRDFRDTWCDIARDEPAAVHVRYALVQADEEGIYSVVRDAAFSWQAAGPGILALFKSGLDDDFGVYVTVNAHALVYSIPRAA
jgi:hypothetical protein